MDYEGKSESHSGVSDSLPSHGWRGSHSLLQGIFPTQGLNPGFLHRRQILYQLSHKGSPLDYIDHETLQARILEWVAFPCSRESSQPRNRTRVSCIAGRFFTSWASREAQEYWSELSGMGKSPCMCVHAKSLQLRLILCSPMDCSTPGSPAHGVFQARILEWVAISSSRGSSQSLDLEDPHKRHAFLSPALAGGFFTTSATWEAQITIEISKERQLYLQGSSNLFLIHFLIRDSYSHFYL